MINPRIIQGQYKNKTLEVPSSARPVTDRVKKTLFDNLNNIFDFAETEVLDLFAGSGNLGIEALSRGSKHCTFVDNSTEAINTIKNNLRKLEITDTHALVLKEDSVTFINDTSTQYDLVLIDPPFEHANMLIGLNFKQIIKESGVLVIKYPENTSYDTPQGFELYKTQKIGINSIDILIRT